jgi:Copper amine oxidase, N2 domain
MASTTAVASARATHPLDPLTAEEITGAWEILRSQKTLRPRTRVVSIALQEPPKEAVLAHRPGDALERAAAVVLMDSAEGKTYEAVVSLTRKDVVAWRHVPGVQPSIVLDEFFECEAAVNQYPRGAPTNSERFSGSKKIHSPIGPSRNVYPSLRAEQRAAPNSHRNSTCRRGADALRMARGSVKCRSLRQRGRALTADVRGIHTDRPKFRWFVAQDPGNV